MKVESRGCTLFYFQTLNYSTSSCTQQNLTQALNYMMKRQLKALPDCPQRNYLPDTFKVKTWKSIEPYFKELLRRTIPDEAALEVWISNRSELQAIFEDDILLRQVQSMQDQQDEQLRDAYKYSLLYMLPRLKAYEHKLDKRFLSLEFISTLGNRYQPYIEKIKREVALYNQKNVKAQSELISEGYRYEQRMNKLQNQQERQARASANKNTRAEKERHFQNWTTLLQENEKYFESLLEELLQKRQETAERVDFADFNTYQGARDFKHSYGATEIEHLHEQVKKWVLPLLDESLEQKRKRLKLEKLRPWDLDDQEFSQNTQPIARSTNELLEVTHTCLDSVYPPFAEHLQQMATYELMDLSPRPNKAKREYLSSFHENRYAFLSMNATGELRDLQLLLKQMGKVMQSYYTSDIQPYCLQSTHPEVTELAGYTLQLFAMHHWPARVFDESKTALHAQAHTLENSLLSIVRLTIGDAFQRWLHAHPKHSAAERKTAWLAIHTSYFPEIVDWNGLEELRALAWLEEYPVFQEPERYLQQLLARLGSFAAWRDYRAWPLQTLQGYLGFLKQGGQQNLEESFSSLGLHLAYPDDFIEGLMDYLREQLQALQN